MTDSPAPAPTPEQPDTPPVRSFSQEDVNRLLADQKRKLLADQPDLTELRKKAAAHDEAEQARLSDLEKASRRIAELEQAAAQAQERASMALRRSAIVAAAQRAGAVDPDAVLALLPGDAVTVGEDGTVAGAEDAVTALLASKTYLVAKPAAAPTPTPGGADGGPRGAHSGGSISRDDLKTMTPDQIAGAYRRGELRHLTSPDT